MTGLGPDGAVFVLRRVAGVWPTLSCPLSGLAGPQPWQQAGTDIKPAQGLRLARTSCPQGASHGRVPASTSACVVASRRVVDSSARHAPRINPRSGFAEKFAETGLLVPANAVPMAWLGLILSDLIRSDPALGLSGAWPVRLQRPRRRQRRGMASLRGASSASAGAGVAWVCVGVCVRLWGCVGVESVACVVSVVGVDSVVGGLVCGGWIGAEMCGDWNAGLVEINVGAVCGWYINSEEKNFGKGFGKGMAISLLVHKN